ncbi:MAG: hypothetical protein MRY78_08690, partial [Saprospiraceae bacterium]|nr:hypothetical protein [Saprospiraceae bacterium]
MRYKMITKSYNTMNQKLSLFTFIFLLSTLTLQAQLPSCLQFEGLDPNTSYGSNTTYEPGDVFHTEQQVNMSLETFYYPDGSSAFWNLQTTTNIFNEFPDASDQYLFISNINLTFDLTPLENTFDQLCFSFFDGGGVENLAINGSDPIVVDNLQQLPNDINGVTISVQTNSENPNIGELCLSGNIQTLTIGGQEFGLDALCFFLSNECDISNIEITPQPCNPNNIFYADVQFDYANVNSDGFTIFGNGQNYGQYAYHELPIEIGPFLADSSTYELIIEDLGDESCQAITEFTAEDCVTECPISNLQITTPGCNQDSVDLFVDFESTMLNGNFLLYLNEEVYGEYAINELPLYLPNIDFDTNEVIAKVCLGSSDCCLDVPLFLDDCQNNCIGFEELTPGDSFGGNDGNVAGDTLLQTDAYHILLQPYLYENGNTDFVTLFVEDGTFLNPDPTEGNTVFPSNINMEVNFADQLNVDQVCFDFYDFGGSVNLGVNGSLAFAEDFSSFHGQELANGVWVDVFQNEELDFPAGTVCLTGTIEQLTLGGQELTIDDICYEATLPECHINNLLAEALACDNDSFLVLLTFELDDPSALSDDFLVYQNDNLLGDFPLNSTTSAYTLELGPFAGNGDTQYEFSVVAGNDINDCTASYQLGGIDCQDESCRIEDLNAYIEGCEAGNYLLNVDFDVINPQNPFFAVFVNGEFMGEFTFDQFPVVLDGIEPFAPAGANGLIVEVGNSNNPECAAETFVDFIDCEEDNCVLFENLLIEGAGSAYANEPGDFIYHENGVNLFVESFTTNSNTGTFGNLLVKNKAQEPSFTAASGRFIQLEEIVAKFTFDQTASVINFDFQATSGLLSIAANGQPPLF